MRLPYLSLIIVGPHRSSARNKPHLNEDLFWSSPIIRQKIETNLNVLLFFLIGTYSEPNHKISETNPPTCLGRQQCIELQSASAIFIIVVFYYAVKNGERSSFFLCGEEWESGEVYSMIVLDFQ